MKTRRPTEDAANNVTLWDVFAATGISAMVLVEHVQYAERDDAWFIKLDDLVHQLDNAVYVMSAACMEYEDLFRIAMAELPEGMAAIRIKNPLFDRKTEEPKDHSNGSSRGGLDDIPF
jgi:hypothetical protein